MKLSAQVRVVPMEGYDRSRTSSITPSESSYARVAPLRAAIGRTRNWLLGEQDADGYWVAELEGDTILESEFILLMAYLGREQDELARQAARYIADQQLESGGWGLYPGSPLDISVSVKAYFALKLTGEDPASEPMQRARGAILKAGGADRVNSFTRFYLALLGQISYQHCPEVPPEVVLLPDWLPVSLARVSAWSRTIIVPLSIISAHRPARTLAMNQGIRELFIRNPEDWPPLRCPGQTGGTGLLSWDRFFRFTDGALRWCRDHGLLPLRRRAIQQAERWMVDRFEGSDGLGAIFPPIVWSIVALECLGYAKDSPELEYCHQQLEDLVIREEETARLQPCKSPVWDTAITLRALAATGSTSDEPAIGQAIDWLLDKEVRRPGDWSQTVKAAAGGWYFEHNNEFYPDLDDTAMVLLALRELTDEAQPTSDAIPPRLRIVDAQQAATISDARRQALRADEIAAAAERAIAWTLAMQNSDGGWGAFDRDNDNEFLCHVPFADHNAMIDPSTPDLTARVLEGLGAWGYTQSHPAIARAVAYLRSTQEPDGSWFGRWGVNYIYGTWQTLVGLTAVGIATDDEAVERAANWLLCYQQPSGGWGESPDSYVNPALRGQGNPTASQTAWAVLGLLAAGRAEHPSVARGVQFLIETQQADGTWAEPEFTGTGFPQVFYLRYHYYPIYFPLLALGQWAAVGNHLPEPSAVLEYSPEMSQYPQLAPK